MNEIPIDPAAFLDRLTQESGVERAVLLTLDGLVKAASQGVSRNTMEATAAMTSGLLAAARAASGAIAEPVTARRADGRLDMADGPRLRQVVAETDDGFLIVMDAGDLTALAVWARGDADIGVVVSRALDMVAKLGAAVMSAKARP
ncbi:roadblock/LC7 domain-containing protein [Streptomyces xiamenensis]|uniref:roadblock/LC7 domain-containing protein n=1 Tax=Streptomyces xiamenensis TaxID=408015 RepID=UPI0036ECB2A7